MRSIPKTLSTRTPSTRVVAAAAAAVALVLTPVAATALTPATAYAVPNTQQQRPAPAPERIAIDGAYNTRTFTNYPAKDGAAISDRVIRGSDLSRLTPTGEQQLRDRGVTRVIDLRTDIERTLNPNRPVRGADLVIADVMKFAPLAGAADFPGMYRTFVDNPGAREAYRLMILSTTETAAKGETVYIHCTAGRDRTGWGSAVMLRLLGVDQATIEADFLAGNDGVDVAWLRGAFDHVDTVYGSWDNYVRHGLRLSDQQVADFRAAVLA